MEQVMEQGTTSANPLVRIKDWVASLVTITRRDLLMLMIGVSIAMFVCFNLYKWRVNEFIGNHAMFVDGYSYQVEYDAQKNTINTTMSQVKKEAVTGPTKGTK